MKAPIDFYFDFSSPYGYLAANKIVNWCRSSQDRSGSKDGTLPYYRSFINSATAADQYIIFNDHWNGADRFQHTANLRCRGNMNALANLRT